MTNKEIIAFLNDAENIKNCKECPYNDIATSDERRYPCGQYRCWVAEHVKHE